jgi:hypothetical protein
MAKTIILIFSSSYILRVGRSRDLSEDGHAHGALGPVSVGFPPNESIMVFS